ncbi:MAG: ABC transporter ATP-binding protein [Alistipes sp.]|nr:ABC transporter ATP-binding protein [Alistipes sp.]
MNRSFLDVIPKSFRARGIFVCLTIFVRALLNFVGIAALLPILYLILDAENMHANPVLEWLYTSLGFTTDRNFIFAILGAVVLFIVVKSLVNLLLYHAERNYIYALYRHLSRNLFIEYFNRGLQFIKRENSAVLSRNVNVVCYTFIVGVLRPLATLASEVLLLAMLFVSIALYSPMSALLAFAVFVPATLLYYTLMRSRLGRYGTIENEAQRRKYRDVIDTYRGFADIEINNAFVHQLSSFEKEVDTIISVGRKNATISMLPQNFTEVALAIGMAALVVFSATSGSEDAKILFGLFAVAALRLLPSVRAMMSAWGALRYNRYTIDILREMGSQASTPSRNNSEERFEFKDKIEVRNIAFHFEDSDHDTLLDLSLTINKGEKVGINGTSGAGKTTLLNLLLGLYTPTEGEILIDGERLDSSLIRKWQNSIGYVSQSVFLKDSTLLANIALGIDEKDIDMERVERAIEAASLSEFVASLPNGLQTRIGECGSLLSGGQRQRIGIARALYKQADILFFDEATSSLDSATEQSINHAIEHLSSSHKDLTIVVVAHRDSSLGYCDRIITLEKRTKWSIV